MSWFPFLATFRSLSIRLWPQLCLYSAGYCTTFCCDITKLHWLTLSVLSWPHEHS